MQAKTLLTVSSSVFARVSNPAFFKSDSDVFNCYSIQVKHCS